MGRLNWWQRASLKSFTPSERVAIGLAVEAEIKAQGERRGRPQAGVISENFNEFPQGRTADIAAQKAGFGNENTYRQAKAVVEQGSPELVAAMDSGAIAGRDARDAGLKILHSLLGVDPTLVSPAAISV